MNITTEDDVVEAFAYQKPDTEAQQKHILIQTSAMDFGLDIIKHVPNCHTRQKALDALQEAKMWANAAIAHKGKY
ncbi:MAG: hypothetical protein GY906_07790 [bacterium]|nr:hypothetical protein [bacterium]